MVYPSRRALVLLGLVVAVCMCSGIAGDAAAEFQRAIRQGSGACPAGTTIDPLRAACARCPAGYTRTVLPLDAMACERPATVLHARTTRRGLATGPLGTDCPTNQFAHLLALPRYCYSCPAGYTRTGSGINAGDACAKPVLPSYSAAQWRAACPAGAFRDLLRGDCWSCPANWIRTAAAVDSPNACTNNPVEILGVDSRAICTGALDALEKGTAAAGAVNDAMASALSPILQPIGDGVRQVSSSVTTAAGFDKLFAKAASLVPPQPAVFDEIVRLGGLAESARERLAGLLLTPAFTCDGNLRLLDQELMSLGMRAGRGVPDPSSERAMFAVLRHPRSWSDSSGPRSQTGRMFYGIALEASAISPYWAQGVTSVTVVTDLAGNGGVLWSLGLAGGAKQPRAVDVGLTLMLFPDARLEDFTGFQTLGVQITADVGGPAAALYKTLRGSMGGSKATVQPSPLLPAIAFSFDLPKLVTEGRLRYGIGANWTLLRNAAAWKKAALTSPAMGGVGGTKTPGRGIQVTQPEVGGEVGLKKPPPSSWPSLVVSGDGSVMFPYWKK